MADQDSPGSWQIVLLGGGIGAGKTRIAEVFADEGFTVISADEAGHRVLALSDVGAQVATIWPDVVTRGVVNRSRLGEVVFRDADALHQLEMLTHPFIEAEVRDQIARIEGPVLVEVPITTVFTDDRFVRVAVLTNQDVRLQRAIGRGGEESDIRRRMQSQPSDDEWRTWASSVIDNSGAWESTRPQVVSVIEDLVADD